MDRWVSRTTEMRLLGSIILRPEHWPTVQADFRPELFAYDEHRLIAEAIHEIASKGEKFSSVQIASRLSKRGLDAGDDIIQTLTEVADSVVTTSEIEGLMSFLQEQWKKRHVYEQLATAANEIAASDDDTPASEILERAQKAMIAAFTEQGKQIIKPWNQVLNDLYEEWALAQEGRLELAYPAGLQSLTSVLGGLRRKRMYLVAGRPSMGKSALAMNITKALAGQQNRRSLVFTLEQSASEFAQRALSATIRLPADQWSRYPWTSENKDKLNKGLSRVMEWPIDMVDVRRPTIDQIKTLARVEKAQHPDLTLIVVDYLQEMQMPVGRGSNFATAVGDTASELRALAGELDVALILVSQLSREVERRDDKRPQMSDLRDSGRLEEVADTILFLYRPGYYKQLGSKELENVSEVIVAKNRQGGGAGKTALAYFDQDHMAFQDVDEALKKQYLSRVNETHKDSAA